MVDNNADQPKDLLDLITGFGTNSTKPDGLEIVNGIRSVLSDRGLVIPTIEETAGKIAEIVASHQAPAVSLRKRTIREQHEGSALGREWLVQTDSAIKLGIPEELGYDDSEEFRLSIPEFLQQSDSRLPFPLSVDPRISNLQKLQLAEIPTYINVDEITDQIKISKVPYTVHTCPPKLYRGYYSEALKQIPDYATGSPMTEIIESYLKLYARYPKFFASWADSGNSRSGAGDVPCLRVVGGRPEVGADGVDGPGRGWRVLFRGNKIGT